MTILKKIKLNREFLKLKQYLKNTGSTFTTNGPCVLVSLALYEHKPIYEIEDKLWRTGLNMELFNQLNNVLIYLQQNDAIEWAKNDSQIVKNDLICKDNLKDEWFYDEGRMSFGNISKYFKKGKYLLISKNHMAYMRYQHIYDIYYEGISRARIIVKLK